METRIARGAWQESIYQELIAGKRIVNPTRLLQGNQKKFSDSYYKNFISLLERMEKTGYVVHHEPAAEGGHLNALYSVSKQKNKQDEIHPAEKRWY